MVLLKNIIKRINTDSSKTQTDTTLDLREHSIDDTGGRSLKKHEDPPESTYEWADDSGEGGWWWWMYDEAVAGDTLLGQDKGDLGLYRWSFISLSLSAPSFMARHTT